MPEIQALSGCRPSFELQADLYVSLGPESLFKARSLSFLAVRDRFQIGQARF
jgi:hypothetical protein